LYTCAGKSGKRQETVAAGCVMGEETGVPSDTSPVQHYRHDASSVIRSLRSVMTLRRALLAHKGGHRKGLEDGRFSIGFALLTSFTETRRFPSLKSEVAKPDRTIKIPGVSPW